MPLTNSLTYTVWGTSWAPPTSGNYDSYPAIVPLIRPPSSISNNYRQGSDTSGLEINSWNFYEALTPTIPVGRRVYYDHWWQLDGMPSHKDQADYYKARADGVTYTGSISGFGDPTPVRFTSVWGLSGANDGKISFKNFLQKCVTFGITFDYFLDDTEGYRWYDLGSVYNAYDGTFDSNGIPNGLATYMSVPDPRRTVAIVNDYRFNNNNFKNILNRTFSQEILQQFKDITNNQAYTGTVYDVLQHYTTVTTRQDFKPPWSNTGPDNRFYAYYAYASALYVYNFGTLRKITIVDAISESSLPNIKVFQTEAFPTNAVEAPYVMDLNTHYFARPNIPSFNACMHNYGDLADWLPSNYGYIPNAQTDENKYRVQWNGVSIGTPAYYAFVKEVARLRGMLRSNPTSYQEFISFISSPSDTNNYRKLYQDQKYWYEMMYHICLHGVKFFNGYWSPGEEDAGVQALQNVLDTWKSVSQNNRAVPVSNVNGSTTNLVDRINLEEAATKGVISGGYIPSIGKWIWRLTAAPGISEYTLSNTSQTDLSLNVTIPSNSRGIWITRSVAERPSYVPGFTEPTNQDVVETPTVFIESKPTVVSKSPLSTSPYNSRLLITETELKPNALQEGISNITAYIPPSEPTFEQKFDKVFDYLIGRYEPWWVGVSVEQGKLNAQAALNVSANKNPFDGTDPVADNLFRYTGINPTGWFDIFTHPKNYASAVLAEYVPYERSRNPQQANHRFVDKLYSRINSQSVWYYEGSGSAAFFGTAPKFKWYPDQPFITDSDANAKALTTNFQTMYDNKIERVNIHTPYGAFSTPMPTGAGTGRGRQRQYPWISNRYTGDDWRYDMYLLLRESTTLRDLLPNPNIVRDPANGVIVNGVSDAYLNEVWANREFKTGTYPLPIPEGDNTTLNSFAFHNKGGFNSPVKVGSPWISWPDGITWAGGWWSGEGITYYFDYQTMLKPNGQPMSNLPTPIDTSFQPVGFVPGYWNKFVGFSGISYGFGQNLLNSLDAMSADWGDKIEFIAHMGGMNGAPFVPHDLFTDPTIPGNSDYLKWRFDATVSHWKEKFRSPIDNFAHVFFDASVLNNRTYHEFSQSSGYTDWSNILPSGISFAESIFISWLKDQYNYTRGLSGPNGAKGVLYGIESYNLFLSFVYDPLVYDSGNTDITRYKNEPVGQQQHWNHDDNIAPDLLSSSQTLLTAPRKFGKPFIEQWWKTNGRKKLGEVFSHEDPSVLFMLDPYPFFYGTFIEHDGTSLKWKGIPGTKFIDLGGNQSLIPWKNDRRFRLLYLWPMMLALNATIVDYMHTGNAYCASCYLDFMVSGMYDKRLGNDFVDGMEGKSYPIVSTKPFPRKSPTLGPQNEWTGDINTSEFELLYCCMKAGITLGLDSLGFTNLYEQLP